MLGRRAWAPVVWRATLFAGTLFAATLLACPRRASAEGEISLRVPMGVSVAAQTHFELGVRSDLLWRPERGDFAFGLAGGVSTIGFDDRRQEIGMALQVTPDYGSSVRMGPMLDAGIGSDARARYVYGRGSFQLRTAMVGNDDFIYACSSAIYLEVRRSITGADPGAFETSVGLELGGGFLAAVVRIIAAFGDSG